MKYLLRIFIFPLFVFSSLAVAQVESYASRDWLNGLEALDKVMDMGTDDVLAMDKLELFEVSVQGSAAGSYLLGMWDALVVAKLVCPNPSQSFNQVTAVVRAGIEDRPDYIDVPAAAIISALLTVLYPCEGDQ